MLKYFTQVKKDWIDYNGHMNVAYYYHVFEAAVRELWKSLGFDSEYCNRTGMNLEITEGHIQFIAEAHLGETLHVDSEIFVVEPRGMLVGQQLFRGDMLLCRFGQWNVSIEAKSGEAVRLEDTILENGRSACVSNDTPTPDWIVRKVNMSKSN